MAVENQVIDNLQLRIQKLAETGAVFKVDSFIGPKQIVVTKGTQLTAVESATMPLIPVGIISYKEMKVAPLAVQSDGKLSPILQPIEKESDTFSSKLLPPGTDVTIQIVPDSYYFSDEVQKKENKSKGIQCIIYIPARGNDSYQNIMVREGYAVYDNREYFRLKDMFQSKGAIDRQLVEELSDSQTLAIQDKKGLWAVQYAGSQNISKLIETFNIRVKASEEILKQEVERINKYKDDRLKDKRSPEERLIARKKAIADEKANFTRKYSDSSLGDQLSQKAKRYFPASTGEEIIKQVVAGILPKSVLQIGALWSGIPTANEEKAGLGASSHPVEIIEVRKDGDVRPILGQGFMSMVMGDRPPSEGLTFVFSVNSRGIESFIAPLLTQFRMDPIIPIRNLHLARFTRPLFSNKEYYSKIFGSLPHNLAKLVSKDGSYQVNNSEDVRQLSRTIDLIYLTAPVYVAVKQVQVQNLNSNDGAFTVTVNCGIADVSENFGYFPEYFSTIDDAFEVHQKRVKVVDKIRTEKAIKYIAKQVGAGAQIATFTFNPDDLTPDKSLEVIKEYKDKLKSSNQKGIKFSNYILREGKFVELPTEITATEAAAQAKMKTPSLAERDKSTVGFKNLLVYKPTLATQENYNLLRNLLGVKDVRLGTPDVSEVVNHFELGQQSTSSIPIPAGPSTRYRNARVTRSDIVDRLNPNRVTGFLNTALKVERDAIIDPKLLDAANAMSALFAIGKNGFRAYRYSFSNWRDNVVIGLGERPIIKPFELCAVRNIEAGSTITNMDVEYACSLGMPVVSIAKKQTGFALKLLGVTVGTQADQTNADSLLTAKKPITFYEGNIRSINKNVGIIDVPRDAKYLEALKDVINNKASAKSSEYCPEMTSTFNFAYKNGPADPLNSVYGPYGTLKFHNSVYKSLVTTTSKSTRDDIRVQLDTGTQTTSFNRDTISQTVDFWNNVIKSEVIGKAQKNPLEFEVQYRAGGKQKKLKIGLTDVVTSELGQNLFFFAAGKEPVIVRSSKYEDQLLSLIGTYIRDLNGISTQVVQQPAGKEKPKTPTPVKVSIPTANSFKTLRAKIRNLVQSVINKDKIDLLEVNDTPDTVTSMSQILSTIKGFRGTHFLDESEPYVFSLFYQLGIVDAGKYQMTFKVRPDRVPYVEPTFVDENYESMTMQIYREEPPKELDRVDAYTEALRTNEEFVARMNSKTSLDSYLTEQANQFIATTLGSLDVNALDAKLKNPQYVMAAVQNVLLRYFDLLYSAHILSKSASVLLSKNLKIDLPEDATRRQQGLPDKHVEDKIRSEGQFYKNKIELLKKDLAKLVRPKAPVKIPEGEQTPVGGIPDANDLLLRSGTDINQLSNAILDQLTRIIDTVDQRLYDSKTPSGLHFVSLDNIKRILSFAGIDHPSVISANTTRLLDTLISTFRRTIQILISKKDSSNLFSLTKGTVELKPVIGDDMRLLNDAMQDLLMKIRAIRLASGNSIDFIKKKTLHLRKPIPSIGIIEEYGVSEPLKIPGRKKPTYQVIGSTSTQAYIQLHTNISDLYISENSKIQDLIQEEEGIDAIYNIMREPSEITTVYNMLRSGRAMVRDATVFTNGSNTLFKTNESTESLQNAFRLVRKASINSANIDAYGTLLGMTQPHIEIREPFFLAMGLNKFVAKTTKISSAGDTTSWKLDVYLLPYEAGYTTNRNLKKVNRSLTNQQFGDITAFLGAGYNPTVQIQTLKDDKKFSPEISNKAFQELQKRVGDTKAFEQKLLISRFAISAVFSNLVAIHAIYKAKQKIFAGIIDKSLTHPKDFQDVGTSAGTANVEGFKRWTARRKDLITEIDLRASDFTIASNFGQLGLASTIPVSVAINKTSELLNLGITTGSGILESVVKSKFVTGKFTSGFGKAAVKWGGAALSAITQGMSIVTSLLDARASNLVINRQAASIIDQSVKNNISVYVLLSQNFSVYALEFLQDYFAAEASAPGGGQRLIELMSREAQSVVANAGSLTGIAYFNNATEQTNEKVSSIAGAFVSTYPVDSLIQKGDQESFFMVGDRRIDNVSIVVVNSAITGDSDALNEDKSFKTLARNFYETSDVNLTPGAGVTTNTIQTYLADKGKGSFFDTYYRNFGKDKNRRTQVDLCGEELLQLLIDGQSAIYKTDIYSIALNPKYVTAEPSLYYSALQGILGRLKLNHFAEYLIGPQTLTLHTNRVDLLFDQTNPDFIHYLDKYLGIKGESVLKRTKTAAQIRTAVTDTPPAILAAIMNNLTNNFPLANGKAIFSKVSDLINSTLEIPENKLYLRNNIYKYDNLLRSANSLCKQILSQAPETKRSGLPVPSVFAVKNFFGASINDYGTDTDRDSRPDTYAIPGETTLGTSEQEIASLKQQSDKFSPAQIEDFWRQYKTSAINHIVWLLDSYSAMIAGADKGMMTKTDPAYALRNAVMTQLATNEASEKGITFELAAETIRQTSANDLKDFLTNQRTESTGIRAEDIQKACDQIALYSDGNAQGKQALYNEYVVFLNTFKELFIQIPFYKDPQDGLVKGFENVTSDPNTYSFTQRKNAYLWKNLDTYTLQAIEKSTGMKPNELVARFNTQRAVSALGNYEVGIDYSFSDVRLDSESYKAVFKVYSFMSSRTGIERPEYIPAVLGLFSIDGNKQLSFKQTDICLEMLQRYSFAVDASTARYLKDAATLYLSGGAPPFSGKAMAAAAEIALSAGFFALSKGGPLAGLAIAVLTFIAVLVVQYLFLSEPPSIAAFSQSFMDRLRTKINTSKIAVTPLFTGMKALLALSQQINETDLVVIPSLGTTGINDIGSRKVNYVSPPDIDNALDANEYIIQDTLSYLTLPLITKRQVSTVADVLSPGGNIIPDIKKINENQKAINSTLLVQEGFFKDHLEKLPEFIEIEKAKALAINAPGLNSNPLEPQPGSLQHDWFQGTLRFINNMEGIYFGDASVKNIGNQAGQYLNHNVNGTNSFVINTKNQLQYIYRRLVPHVLSGFGSEQTDALQRKLYDATVSINAAGRKVREESSILAADVLFPRDQVSVEAAKQAASKKGLDLTVRTPANYFKENAFYLAAKKPVGAVDDKEYARFANRALLLSSLFDSSTKDTIKALELAGATDSTVVFDDNKNYLNLDHALWADASFGADKEPTVYFKFATSKILEVRGFKRGDSFATFSKAHAFIMREAGPEGRVLARANNSKESEGFLISRARGAGPADNSDLLSNAAHVFIARKSVINRNVILSERFLYIFNQRITQPVVNKAKADGAVFMEAASAMRQQYANLADTQYMMIPASGPAQQFSFVEAYAAKLALDEQFIENGIRVNWSHIFQAIDDIGSYLAYVGFAADFKNKAGGTVESALYINRSDKVFEAPNGLSISAFKQSNTISNDSINGVFAATSGLTTQYVMDKIEQFVDQQSSLTWDALGKASKEVRNTINAPLRMYPVSKLYFIRKERGGAILYDDLFSYADILSIKVFDSKKTPGSTIVVQLANTENKLENIIAAKDNARNPFEVKARAEDPLSGLMLKAGTRIMVVLGYGNLLTEENKYVGEIEQAVPNPDGTYTITARGPGWILNNQISAMEDKFQGKVPGKTISVTGTDISAAQLPATETDKGKVLVKTLANPQNAIARSLILFMMLRVGNISRYGRLGSILSEIAEESSFAIPNDISDAYTSLVQDGLVANGFTVSNFIANAKNYVSKALIGDLADDAVEIYKNQAAGATTGEVFKFNTFSKNILLSESYPAVDGLVSSIGQWFINKYAKLTGNVIPEWKITNESYWEFMREVLLTVPNAKSFVRTYETDGSLVIGQADEYYTMYKSKSYASRIAEQIFRNLATLKETGSVMDIMRRFTQVIGSVASKPEQETVEMIAEILTGTLASLSFNQIDRAAVNLIVRRVSQTTFPLPIIENQSASNISELFTQLKNTTIQSYVLMDLMNMMIPATQSNTSVPPSFGLALVGGLVTGGALAAPLTTLALNSGSNKKTVTDSFSDPKSILQKPIPARYASVRDNLVALLAAVEKGGNSDMKKLMEMALQMSFSNKIDPDTITSIKDAVDSSVSQNAFAKRLLFTLTLNVCRAFSNKMHKLRTLSPDKRKVQEQYFMFSGRDIIHNGATTMLGYNEGEFVFDEVNTSTGETSGLPNLPGVGALLSYFGTKITRFGFAVDPVSSESGGTGDYTSKRLIVNLSNPSYFSAMMSIGNVGINDRKGPILTVLSIMATSQMQELVQDWYGGEILAYGDTERKANDVVFMYDYIRDMYGPFEIKEVVHSMDNFGFLSSYTPSVYTRSEPRNITDETDGSSANLVANVVLGGIAGFAIYKSRGVFAKLLGKIPGLGRNLTKFNLSVAKGIGSLVSGDLKSTKGILSYAGGRLAQGGMWIARRVLIDPIVNNSNYARVAARSIAKRTIKALEVGSKDVLEKWAKSNGFSSAVEMKRVIKNTANATGQIKAFTDARAFFAANPAATVFEFRYAGDQVLKIEKGALQEIDSLLAQVADEAPGSILHALENGSTLAPVKTSVFGKLSEKFTTMGIKTDTIKDIIVGPTFRERTSSFLHFIEGRSYQNRVVQEIAGVTNIGNIAIALKTADEAIVTAVVNLSVDELKLINKGQKYAKAERIFADGAEDFALKLETSTTKSMQEAFVTATTPEAQQRMLTSFFDNMEKLVSGKSIKPFKINGVLISPTKDDIARFREVLTIRNQTIASMFGTVEAKLKTMQAELANPNILFKDLSADAKQVLTTAGETFAAEGQQQIKSLNKTLGDINKRIKASQGDGAVLDDLRRRQLETMDKIKGVEKNIAAFKKSTDSSVVREQAAKNLKDAVDKNSAKLRDAVEEIGKTNLKDQVGDPMLARILSSEDGALRTPGFNTIRNITKETRDTLLSKNPLASFGSIMKGLGTVFTLYQTYGLVRDTLGESITEYRLLLGKQAAANSLITEFMVYKGEPFLSNLEGLTRNGSKLITGDTTYLEYLKSRFYNPTEIADFLTSNYASIVSTSLTQYSDQLLSTSIDPGLYLSQDSGLSFAQGGTGFDSGVLNAIAAAPGVSDPGAVVSPFYETANTGGVWISSGYGYRVLGRSASWDPGIDLKYANNKNMSKSNDGNVMSQINGVRALEAGIAIGPHNNRVTFQQVAASSWPLGGVQQGGPLISVGLLGLGSATVWTYYHCFPELGGSTGWNQTMWDSVKNKVFTVNAGDRLGFMGPYGQISGPHIHLNAATGFTDKVFLDMVELHKQGGNKPIKENAALAEYIAKNQKAIHNFMVSACNEGSGIGKLKLVDPEVRLKKPEMKFAAFFARLPYIKDYRHLEVPYEVRSVRSIDNARKCAAIWNVPLGSV